MHRFNEFYYWTGVIAWWAMWIVIGWKATNWLRDKWGEAVARMWIHSWIGQAWETYGIYRRFVVKGVKMTDDLDRLAMAERLYATGERKEFIWASFYLRLIRARIIERKKEINEYLTSVGECKLFDEGTWLEVQFNPSQLSDLDNEADAVREDH